ncbi:hypothetical protein [Streptococcus suis]|uniref:hypothetical protein n=1 Tax=Streptococcus suis TaxID=1307 RepID=UPI001960EBEB|nr:hypothetical protein [Streptococcus suis]MBM7283246.1 hypothetical protein [Streptococcus suis]MCO8237395.1 hypothetical protein [Streptococcus suis]HEM3531978.1 hypothetical protein [Streptococcus suis]
MIQRHRAFYEGKMYGVKAVIWTSRGLYVTLDEGNKAGRRVRSAKLMQSTGKSRCMLGIFYIIQTKTRTTMALSNLMKTY